jgi:FkbM family methyltransferase
MIEDIVRNIIKDELLDNIKNDHSIHKPFAVYMGEGVVLTRSFYDIMYEVSSFDCTMTPHLIIHGVYESELTKYLINNIKEDSIFVDVGANFGYYTCLIAKRISANKGGKVYSFEPNKTAFELLQKNVMMNWIDWSSVSLNQLALSDSKGEVLFKNYKYRFGGSQFYTVEESSTNINQMEVVKVKTDTLDYVLRDATKVDFMKIDVEGAEFKVIKGAENIINLNKDIKILIEWSISQFEGQGINPANLADFFKIQNFRPHILNWENGNATEVSYDFILTTQEHICAILFSR